MGWLRAMFTGHTPDNTRKMMKLVLRQNLKRLAHRPPTFRAIEAAANTLANRYRARRIERDFDVVLLEVLPFCFLDSRNCENAFAEYAVMIEHRGEGDVEALISHVRKGVVSFASSPAPEYAPFKARLFQAIDADLIPWYLLLDEATLGDLWDGMKQGEQMGFDTSEMQDDR
jgi:hypothetical protein